MEMGLDIAYVQGDCPTFIMYSVPTKYKWTRLLGHSVMETVKKNVNPLLNANKRNKDRNIPK